MGKRTTILDIAEKSGYSKTAVSFAFNAPERISKEARERILAIARDLDYIPDPMARNFSKGKHMSIGFLLPQRADLALRNPYMQTVILGIAAVCQEHEHVLSLIPPLRSSIPDAVRNAPVDGLITMGLFVDKGIRDVLRRRMLPIVSIDGSEEDGFPSVGIDDTGAAEAQMKMALEAGHRDIAVISLPDSAYGKGGTNTIVGRRNLGYERALSGYGISWSDTPKIQAEATFAGGKDALKSILASHRPTCIVTMADTTALGAISAIREAGLSVPDDISVIGFDGIEHTSGLALSTVVQSAEEKGRRSAVLLFQILSGEDVNSSQTVEFTLEKGDTLKAI